MGRPVVDPGALPEATSAWPGRWWLRYRTRRTLAVAQAVVLGAVRFGSVVRRSRDEQSEPRRAHHFLDGDKWLSSDHSMHSACTARVKETAVPCITRVLSRAGVIWPAVLHSARPVEPSMPSMTSRRHRRGTPLTAGGDAAADPRPRGAQRRLSLAAEAPHLPALDSCSQWPAAVSNAEMAELVARGVRTRLTIRVLRRWRRIPRSEAARGARRGALRASVLRPPSRGRTNAHG